MGPVHGVPAGPRRGYSRSLPEVAPMEKIILFGMWDGAPWIALTLTPSMTGTADMLELNAHAQWGERRKGDTRGSTVRANLVTVEALLGGFIH